jgi:hypothetical protein
MEAIEYVEGAGAALADHPQIGLPHVRADEGDLLGEVLCDHREEALEAVGAWGNHPQVPRTNQFI